MTREHFDRDLDDLRTRILALGSEVEHNLGKAAEAMIKRNATLAERLIEFDERVNSQRINLVMDGLTLIATQQPMARDMRFIATVIEIAGELERMHDYVKGIAKTSLDLGSDLELLPLFNEDFPRMAEITQNMLKGAMTAFSEKDAVLAQDLAKWDNQVDHLFNRLYVDIVAYAASSPGNVPRANQLEWTVHNMERAADRVLNICEWIVYMVTGEYREFVSRYAEFESPPSTYPLVAASAANAAAND